MPNGNPNSINWTTIEFEKLVQLIKPHTFLYNVQDPTRKDILARESTWELIAKELCKPVEECKKRWRSLRDSYMKTVRASNWKKPKIGLFKNLEFLSEAEVPENDDEEREQDTENVVESLREDTEQQVITDNQEYYEITLVDNPQDEKGTYIPKKLIIPPLHTGEPPRKKEIGKKKYGRKRSMPIPVGLQPIKILPKPTPLMNGPKIIQYGTVEETSKVLPQTSQPQRSEVLDSLIEMVLKEHTNEIDVFFRSMAASVKKLQPNLIPKVKMEVCNVIAKYEMQSFDKNTNSF